MSGPRVYTSASETAPVNVIEGDHQPIPAVLDGDGKIFVSIVSYRDGERCGETLKSIFENAKDPDRVIVGVVEQNTPDDMFCIEQYCKSFGVTEVERFKVRDDVVKIFNKVDEQARCPRFDQIRLVGFHHITAKGPMFARSLVKKVLGNEEFCMQVDAHTTFLKDWDALVLKDWKAANNEFGIISTAPAALDGENAKEDYEEGGSKYNQVPRQCKVIFRENGFLDYSSPADAFAFDLETPLLSHAWSAGFSFSKCHLEETTPHDPFSWYAKPVEQFSRFLRFWTRGYDVYTPTHNIVLHDYGEQANGHGNNEWFRRQRDRFRLGAINRAKLLMRMGDTTTRDTELANMGIYGIGKRRTLEQLYAFLQLDVPNKIGNRGDAIPCATKQWVPYDASISPVANLLDNPDNLDPQPEFPMRTELKFYEQVDVPYHSIALDMPAADGKPALAAAMAVAGGGAAAVPDIHQVDSFQPGVSDSLPSASILFLFWVFGLVVWCIMFLGPMHQQAKVTPRKRGGGGGGGIKDV